MVTVDLSADAVCTRSGKAFARAFAVGLNSIQTSCAISSMSFNPGGSTMSVPYDPTLPLSQAATTATMSLWMLDDGSGPRP